MITSRIRIASRFRAALAVALLAPAAFPGPLAAVAAPLTVVPPLAVDAPGGWADAPAPGTLTGAAAVPVRAAATPIPGVQDPTSEGLYAEIFTNRGTIVARLDHERAPLATASFVGLAEGSIANAAFDGGRPFYDGTIFHRVVEGHVIQAGAPDSDRAGGPGYTYPTQVHAELNHGRAGVLGVANSGPHTNGSQFYITLGDRSYLDPIYPVFGEVVDGLEVVMEIREGDWVDSVRIRREGTEAEAYRPDTALFDELVREAEAEVERHERARRELEEAWLAEHRPALEGTSDEVRSLLLSGPGEGEPGPAGPDTLRVRYTGIALHYLAYQVGYDGPPLLELPFASGPEGEPGSFGSPQTFAFPGGQTGPDDGVRVNPGLDGVIAGMRPGQRKLVVVPGELGYGSAGYFGPDLPGEARFRILPFTMLVYEVEVLEGAG
jgi:cyclophilin family peptidyl-prolyl cis-trans isomerase